MFTISIIAEYVVGCLPPDAVVGLERTFYQVSENVGVVEVCAIVYSPNITCPNITCPIGFPFDVRLRTRDGSAGKEQDKITINKI